MALLKDGTRIYGNATVDSTLTVNGNITVSKIYNSGNTWTFGEDSTFMMPTGGIIVEGLTSIAGGPTVNNIELVPYGGNDTNQRLVIYPTAAEGNHVHLTSGNLQVTDIFLGNDNQFVKTNADGGMSIGTNVGPFGSGLNGNIWIFSTTGNLTLPAGGTINFSDGSNALVGGGSIGVTGPTGPNGTNGLDGATGPTGPQGSIGPTGPSVPSVSTAFNVTDNNNISIDNTTFWFNSGVIYVACSDVGGAYYQWTGQTIFNNSTTATYGSSGTVGDKDTGVPLNTGHEFQSAGDSVNINLMDSQYGHIYHIVAMGSPSGSNYGSMNVQRIL